MLAVGLGADAIRPYLADLEAKVVVACDNSPALVTLSGDEIAIQVIQAKLDAAGVFNRIVKTGGKAYHSHHMTAVSVKYKHLVEKAKQGRNQSPRLDTAAKMVSSVTNSVLPQGTVLDAGYWSTNLRSPVLFRQAVETLLTSEEFSEVDLFLEIGPHSAMAGPVKQIVQGVKGKEKTEYVATLLRNEECSVRLLKVAGELFLRSYENLDMKKVAHAYVDDQLASSVNGKHVSLKGCIIVDLPPYQWNYTRSLWAESRTSREHRQAKFPRHDVLGQLVLGNSLAEPTWRNMLRVSDLPWLKDHHLGGENVFPAAGYFAMAIEAIRQINEMSDKPIPIETFVLRDISIKTALVIPGDDNGIEVLLNMRPSIYGHAEWDWRVSSVETTGIQKDHMSGSIRINSHARDRTPRPIPHFSQRASGKAWNQALRDVGFDYGATFQDMDNIRFDGKNYHAACDTNIKQIVDPSLGESRYVLHPASIDSTLQLCIAAIYAGRTQAMDCGVVPVQVDEVTIWPPTKQQLDTQKAIAYAHVHKRGLRTSESTVQMMSAENGEMIMEITNLRATAYEAAVPPKAESALVDAPYGKMTWDLDIDIVENRQGLTTADLVNLALFKHPNFKVVELGFKNAASVLNRNPEALWTIIITSDEEDKAAQLIVADYHNAKIIKLDLQQELESQGLTAGSTDILIAHAEKPSLLGSLGSLLKPGATPINSELIISTKMTDEIPIKARFVQLIYHKTQLPIISKIKIVLQEKFGWDVTVTKLSDSLLSSIAEHTIMLADLEAPLLFNLKEDEFLAIQNIIAKTSSLLWVSTGAILSGKRPEYAMVSGLARSITSEQASIDFRVIDIDIDTVKPESIAQSITNVARLQSDRAEELPEREFCIANGKTYISRLVRNHDLNKLYNLSAPVSTSFTPGDRITGLIIKNKVVFQQQEQTTSIKPGYVEVQIQSSGLTKEGVLTITGSDYATTFSHEIGGIVTRIGSGVSSFKPGDRVVGYNFGHFESYQEVPVTLLRKLSASDDLIKATTSNLIAFATALHGLVNLAAVRAGENVLVLNKTGFAGAAAIQIAQQKGANVYTVVETDDEVKFLIDQLDLDNNHIIKASDGLLSESFEAISGGHGADIVFSAGGSVDQHHAHEAWRCIAPFGRFLDSGRKGTLGGLVIDGLPIHKSASYLPFDILEIGKSRPEVLSHLLPTIVDMSSAATPLNVKTINLGELDTAVSAFSDSFGAVKSMAQYQTSASSLQFLPPRASKLHFSPDATYLLVGCLGGLGRSLTSWMMEAGARRFTFLSRSGADAASAAECVRDLETAGAFVQVVRGDATSRADVVQAVKGVSSQNPIKGVVHAAMVLRVSLSSYSKRPVCS